MYKRQVVDIGAEGQVAQARGFGTADRIFDGGLGAVDLLQAGDAPSLLVGCEHLEAVALRIAEGELRSGVGPLPAADGPGAWGPAGGGEVQGEFCHPGPVPLLSLIHISEP